MLGVSAALVIGIGTGVLIGGFSGPERVPSAYENAIREPDESISEMLINEMKSQNVREFLR